MRQRSALSLRFFLAVACSVAGWLLAPDPACTQTSAGLCGSDSLALVSPAEEGLEIRLSSPGQRFGVTLNWPQLSDAVSTCAALTHTEQLPFSVEVAGDYKDSVDRQIDFFTLDRGTIGDPSRNRLLFRWTNVYVARSGRIQGEFNISNSGGLLRYNPSSQSWTSDNDGLPRYLPYTNVMALAESRVDPGHALLHLDAAPAPPGTSGRGLWQRRQASGWTRIAADRFPDGKSITALAFSPSRDDAYVVGTAQQGFYVTLDDGATYTQFAAGLPGLPNPPPTLFQVTMLNWVDDGRLFAAIRAFGLFLSNDGGLSFAKLPNLLVPQYIQYPDSTRIVPQISQLAVDPQDANHLLLAIKTHAIYHSRDGGQTWSGLGGDWIVPGQAASADGQAVAISPQDPQIILVGTGSKGLWRTDNGGAHWERVGGDLAPGGVWTGRPIVGVTFSAEQPSRVFACADGLGLLVSDDAGASWTSASVQPTDKQAWSLQRAREGSGDLWLLSYGGGIYVPGTPVELTRTINRGTTDPLYANLDLGLTITFGAGSVDSGTAFTLKCQDFQGWAVWRSVSTNPLDMELIGLYDKTNPATCIEGYCGDQNFIISPNCYDEKRAACFDLTSVPGRVRFFDGDVYNGFTYYYAVTTFDYGNTAGIEPPSLTNDLQFSPRYPSTYTLSLNPPLLVDPGTIYPGPGNMKIFDVDVVAAPDLDGPEIYCFPNPLRRDLGFPGKEGEQVKWTNLPAGSSVQVFTVDGDIVAELGPEEQRGSNMPWVTRADGGKGDLLASGIYIWRVRMPARGDFWGKLVIIR